MESISRTLSCRCLALLLLAGATVQAQPLDPAFGSVGRRIVGFDQPGTVGRDAGVAVFPFGAGKMLTVGTADVADANTSVIGIGLVRTLESGALDPVFEGGGITVKNAGMTSVTDATVGPFQKILVTGSYGEDSALVWFNASGAVNTLFAGDGGEVWDVSGIGQLDVPTAIVEVRGKFFLGGHYDRVPGVGVDHDVFLARINQSTAVMSVVQRDELFTEADRMIDLEPVGASAATALLVSLADSELAGLAGNLRVFDPATEAPLRTVVLFDLLGAGAGCAAGHDNARSVDLVPLSSRTVAVVGNLRASDGFPVQAYVIVVDTTDGLVISARCGPLYNDFPNLISVTGATALPSDTQSANLHFAMASNYRIGYWRWSAAGGQSGYQPDRRYHGGQRVEVEFASDLGIGTQVALDDQARPVVVGTTALNQSNQDVALVRLIASEDIFRDSFGN